MNIAGLTLQEAIELEKQAKAQVQAELRAYVQKLDMFIEFYDEFKEYPDKDFILSAKNSTDRLKKYIDQII